MAAKKPAQPKLKPIQDEFIAWLLMDRRSRRIHRMPDSEKEWAEYKGVSDRTTRRWKEQPAFQALLAQRQLELARALTPNSTVMAEQLGGPAPVTHARSKAKFEPPPPAGPGDDPLEREDLSADERSYLKVKDALAAAAGEGSHQAIDLWLKHYGRSFIEAEQASDEGLIGLDEDGLADELVRLLGSERVAAAMARAGGPA